MIHPIYTRCALLLIGVFVASIALAQPNAQAQKTKQTQTKTVKTPIVEAENTSKSSKKLPASKSTSKVSKNTTAKNTSEKKPSATDSDGGLYVYMDDDGVPHYAMQPLDERYKLFANSGPVIHNTMRLAVGLPDKNLKLLAQQMKNQERLAAQMLNMDNVGLSTYAYAPPAAGALVRRLINNPGLARYDALIRRTASLKGVDANLVKAVMAAESGFNVTALSNKNAMGLMQVIPPTAARYGVGAHELMVPERNIHAGVSYLRDLSRMFSGRPELVIAAYNAGEGAVYKYKRTIPPYAETQNYVRKVMQYYQVYNGQAGSVSALGQQGKKRAVQDDVTQDNTGTGKKSLNQRRAMQRVNGRTGRNGHMLISSAQ